MKFIEILKEFQAKFTDFLKKTCPADHFYPKPKTKKFI
jgi:hypothetical protein